MGSPAIVYSFPPPFQVLNLEEKLSGEIETFVTLLKKWGKVHNLTSSIDDGEVRKHVRLSLSFALVVDKELFEFGEPLSKASFRVADVGSGAGFPGLFVALYFERVKTFKDEEILVELFEIRKKRAAFLRRVSFELGLSKTSIVPDKFSCTQGARYDAITGRAVMSPESFVKAFSECGRKVIYMGSEGLWEGYSRFYRSRIGNLEFWAGVFDGANGV